jgi:type IV pilus biogenesis/stability protein PilW
MSSRASRRDPGSSQPGPQALPTQAVAARRASKGLRILLFAAIGIGAAIYWVARFHQSPVTDANALPAGTSASQLAPPSPANNRAQRDGRREEAFKAQINRGTTLLGAGKPNEALEAFSEAFKLNPGDEDVHYDMGLALTRLGRSEEAIQQYRLALEIFPKYVEAHNNLGNLLMRGGHNDEAIQHFEQALQILPDFASAHNNLGTALERAGRTNEATLHFERAIKIDPNYWQARFNMALNRVADGRLDEARTELETVLRSQPNFAPAKAALEEVQARSAK